ncbi:MAG: hypothetical protein KDA21_06650, partial [Phycisphaerales bacterium]|nr:hypothetical protein [Phycisphaerales bacterium]
WLRPSTALLVWQPDSAVPITSGRQLFGSGTWLMRFSNGYRAMDALDDDRDGVLRGDELRHLAAWFDRNSDGVSQPDEVRPLDSLGVVGLRTEITGYAGDSPMNPRGLIMRDGRELPTWDWVTSPAAEPER